MLLLLYWLLLIEALGLIVYPITRRIFSRLPDQGWTLSKPLGLLLLGYGTWLTGLSHTIPNAPWTVLTVALVLCGVAAWAARGRWRELGGRLRADRSYLLISELLFVGVFLGWGLIRGSISTIAHTEQPMDLMLLNAVVVSPHYPPQDPWLAGEPVSYYYFGYLMVGTLTLVSGVASTVAFNMGLALFAGLSALAAFGTTANLVRLSRRGDARAGVLGGLAAAFLLLVMSNLAGVLDLVRAAGAGSAGFWAWIGLEGLTAPDGPSRSWMPDTGGWWWWGASRVGSGTITEFPAFSFILGDLHPHVMSIPFLLLVASLAVQLYRTPNLFTPSGWRRQWPLLAATPLCTGALAAINLWDLPLGLALIGGAVMLHRVREGRAPRQQLGPVRRVLLWTALGSVLLLVPLLFVMQDEAIVWVILVQACAVAAGLLLAVSTHVLRTIGIVGALWAASMVLFVPFYLTFESAAVGILPVRGLITRPLHLVLLWGVSGALAVGFLVGTLRRVAEPGGPWGSRFMGAAAIGFAPVVLWLQPVWGALAYAVAMLVLMARRLGFRWAGVDEAPLAIGSGTSRLLGLALIIALLLYDGITAGERGVGGGFSSVSRLLLVIPMALVVTYGIYGAWTLARREAMVSPPGDGAAGRRTDEAVVLVLALTAVSGALVMGAELFHVVDVFGGELRRMNTVFKLYYQAWILFAVVGGFVLYQWGRHLSVQGLRNRLVFAATMVVLVAATAALAYYAIAAVTSRVGAADGFSLDGHAHLRERAGTEYEAIRWIRDHLPRDAVVLEAAVVPCAGNPDGCGSFTEAARIAAATGRPTVLGWEQHETQWRSAFSRLGSRKEDVRTLYETADVGRAREIIERYGVDYVIVGPRERASYGTDGLTKFRELSVPVFTAADPHQPLTVYRVLP